MVHRKLGWWHACDTENFLLDILAQCFCIWRIALNAMHMKKKKLQIFFFTSESLGEYFRGRRQNSTYAPIQLCNGFLIKLFMTISQIINFIQDTQNSQSKSCKASHFPIKTNTMIASTEANKTRKWILTPFSPFRFIAGRRQPSHRMQVAGKSKMHSASSTVDTASNTSAKWIYIFYFRFYVPVVKWNA